MTQGRDSAWIVRFLEDLLDQAERLGLPETAQSIRRTIRIAQQEIDANNDENRPEDSGNKRIH